MNAPRDEADDAEMTAGSPVTTLELGGHLLRVVCVDERLPDHCSRPGSARLRQCYLPDEIGHFEWAGHRYALVPDRSSEAASAEGAELHRLLRNQLPWLILQMLD